MFSFIQHKHEFSCFFVATYVILLFMFFNSCLCFYVAYVIFLLFVFWSSYSFLVTHSPPTIHIFLSYFTFFFSCSPLAIHIHLLSLQYFLYCSMFPSTTHTFLLLIKLSFHVLWVFCLFLPLICTCVGWFKIQNLEFYAPNWF